MKEYPFTEEKILLAAFKIGNFDTPGNGYPPCRSFGMAARADASQLGRLLSIALWAHVRRMTLSNADRLRCHSERSEESPVFSILPLM